MGATSELSWRLLMVILWFKVALGMAFLSFKKNENATQELKLNEVIKNQLFFSKKFKKRSIVGYFDKNRLLSEHFIFIKNNFFWKCNIFFWRGIALVKFPRNTTIWGSQGGQMKGRGVKICSRHVLEIVGIKVFKAYRLKRAFSYSVIEEVVYPDGLSKLIRSKRSVNIGLDTIFSA